jgi:hypothetical protein
MIDTRVTQGLYNHKARLKFTVFIKSLQDGY